MTNKTNNEADRVSTDRRKLLLGSVAVTAALATQTAIAASGKHHHGGAANAGLMTSALECVKESEICLDHCIGMFKTGDTTLADCAAAVNETIAMCTALSKMAAVDSKQLKAVAKVCIDVCKACKKECDKHADKHAACKSCADSCDDCIKACKKIV